MASARCGSPDASSASARAMVTRSDSQPEVRNTRRELGGPSQQTRRGVRLPRGHQQSRFDEQPARGQPGIEIPAGWSVRRRRGDDASPRSPPRSRAIQALANWACSAPAPTVLDDGGRQEPAWRLARRRSPRKASTCARRPRHSWRAGKAARARVPRVSAVTACGRKPLETWSDPTWAWIAGDSSWSRSARPGERSRTGSSRLLRRPGRLADAPRTRRCGSPPPPSPRSVPRRRVPGLRGRDRVGGFPGGRCDVPDVRRGDTRHRMPFRGRTCPSIYLIRWGEADSPTP